MNRRGFLAGLAGLLGAAAAKRVVWAEPAGELWGYPVMVSDVVPDGTITLVDLETGPARTTHYVFNDGPLTLADAIETAGPGDVIYVWPGGKGMIYEG